jgi:hypothetical protein
MTDQHGIGDEGYDLLFEAATKAVSIRNMYTDFWTHRAPARYFTYVLLLQQGKLYVGSTDNIYVRLLDHFTCSPMSAVWVREYGPPERIVEIIVGGPSDTESYVFCMYADRFGYTNVRGGGVCKLMVTHEPQVVKSFEADGRILQSLPRSSILKIQGRVEHLIKKVDHGVSRG